jgi:hypothetical protein
MFHGRFRHNRFLGAAYFRRAFQLKQGTTMKLLKNTDIIRIIFLCAVAVAAPWDGKAETTDQMFPNIVLTRGEYNQWKTAIDAEAASPAKEAYENHIRLLALKIIRDKITPSPVASLSESGAAAKVTDDMKRMYALCLYYAFKQETKYLDKAKEFYLAWAAVNHAVKENSPAETAYTPGIEGYSLIRGCLDATSRASIDAWIRRRANVALADRVRTNNWETIRLHFLLQYGLVLNDQTLINTFRTAYDNFIPINLYPNGTTEDLLGRDAFAYHAYDLLFFARILKTQAAYYGAAQADAEYAREHRWGASVKKAVDFWKPYLLYPDKYTHVEFVETEWAPDKTRSDYNKKYNPSGSMYVVDELYYFDEDLYDCIRKYRGNTLNVTIPLWLSALRWL